MCAPFRSVRAETTLGATARQYSSNFMIIYFPSAGSRGYIMVRSTCQVEAQNHKYNTRTSHRSHDQESLLDDPIFGTEWEGREWGSTVKRPQLLLVWARSSHCSSTLQESLSSIQVAGVGAGIHMEPIGRSAWGTQGEVSQLSLWRAPMTGGSVVREPQRPWIPNPAKVSPAGTGGVTVPCGRRNEELRPTHGFRRRTLGRRGRLDQCSDVWLLPGPPGRPTKAVFGDSRQRAAAVRGTMVVGAQLREAEEQGPLGAPTMVEWRHHHTYFHVCAPLWMCLGLG